jgi:hypothetical protein
MRANDEIIIIITREREGGRGCHDSYTADSYFASQPSRVREGRSDFRLHI